ncbi:MAG: class I SAM-dependent methyltransferase [Elusimicrobia bacterium]|nr:class I SAM-dependent methyltransferase [Elusimicrobiota bacterium]
MSTPLLDKAVAEMNWLFPRMPYVIRISYGGQSRPVGSGPEKVEMACKSVESLRAIARSDIAAFLDHYVVGDADINGDMYAFVGARAHVREDALWRVGWLQRLRYAWLTLFPSPVRRKLLAVSSHYDLSNEFILSYLDQKTKAYSCAIWKDPENIGEPFDETLDDAQHRKHLIAAEALEIQPDDSFLDIGCGYGYMVHLAETQFGCKRATGITLSKNQVETGFSRNLQLKHYLELPAAGQFDKIYTCGMISHLDKSEIVRYYRHVYGLLKKGGRAWFHMISPPASTAGITNYNTISGTFSQKYVFPDHYQFPISKHIRIIEETGFQIRQAHFRYGHYNKTLRHWYRRFVDNLPKTRHLITPELERAWHLFLTYASIIDGPGAYIKQLLCRKP